MQFHGKLIIRTPENNEKPHFGSGLGLLSPNSSHEFFFFFSKIWLRRSLDIMVSYHHITISYSISRILKISIVFAESNTCETLMLGLIR